LATSCERENKETKHLKGSIVGFAPCTIRHHYKIGYVIISEDEKDTLVTYSLSDEVFKMPASVVVNQTDTLYKIPETYFQNYMDSPYFPMAARYQFGIEILYRYAEKDELTILGCTMDVVSLNLLEIIVINASKPK
jgi:hypothetical protein